MSKLTPSSHASHSFSGSARYLACFGSVRMQKNITDVSSEQADLGTAVHEACEFSLRFGLTVHNLIGLEFYGHKITAEMADAGQLYVAYVRNMVESYKGRKLYVEQKVSIKSINAEDLAGTADAIILDLDNRKVYVVDYKNGRIPVEVSDNSQLIGYAIAAIDSNNLWSLVDDVEITIVQPNFQHIDGPVRSQTIGIWELKNWRNKFAEAYHASLRANAPLKAGSHCKYCKAEGFCAANIHYLLNNVSLTQSVEVMTPEQKEEVFEIGERLKPTLDAIKASLLEDARTGSKLTKYKLVKANNTYVCSNTEELSKAVVDAGYKPEDAFNTKPKSRSAVVKMVGSSEINKLFYSVDNGLTLTSRYSKKPAQMPDKLKNNNAAAAFKGVTL